MEESMLWFVVWVGAAFCCVSVLSTQVSEQYVFPSLWDSQLPFMSPGTFVLGQ